MTMRELMRIVEGREAPLYHGTGVGNALRILETNVIEDRTQHDELFGISLSRSRRSAEVFGDVVFALDQQKLAQVHRIVPYDYWGHSGDPALAGSARRHGKYAEGEEFVRGPIRDAARYILAIEISGRVRQRIQRQFPDTARPLLSHPKLVIHEIA